MSPQLIIVKLIPRHWNKDGWMDFCLPCSPVPRLAAPPSVTVLGIKPYRLLPLSVWSRVFHAIFSPHLLAETLWFALPVIQSDLRLAFPAARNFVYGRLIQWCSKWISRLWNILTSPSPVFFSLSSRKRRAWNSTLILPRYTTFSTKSDKLFENHFMQQINTYSWTELIISMQTSNLFRLYINFHSVHPVQESYVTFPQRRSIKL